MKKDEPFKYGPSFFYDFRIAFKIKLTINTRTKAPIKAGKT
jgi:hypothetical protein